MGEKSQFETVCNSDTAYTSYNQDRKQMKSVLRMLKMCDMKVQEKN